MSEKASEFLDAIFGKWGKLIGIALSIAGSVPVAINVLPNLGAFTMRLSVYVFFLVLLILIHHTQRPKPQKNIGFGSAQDEKASPTFLYVIGVAIVLTFAGVDFLTLKSTPIALVESDGLTPAHDRFLIRQDHLKTFRSMKNYQLLVTDEKNGYYIPTTTKLSAQLKASECFPQVYVSDCYIKLIKYTPTILSGILSEVQNGTEDEIRLKIDVGTTDGESYRPSHMTVFTNEKKYRLPWGPRKPRFGPEDDWISLVVEPSFSEPGVYEFECHVELTTDWKEKLNFQIGTDSFEICVVDVAFRSPLGAPDGTNSQAKLDVFVEWDGEKEGKVMTVQPSPVNAAAPEAAPFAAPTPQSTNGNPP